MINFGAIIKKYREQRGATQKELSDKLHITSTYLSALENGRKEPSFLLLKRLGKVLRVPTEVFFWESVQIKDNLNSNQRKAIEVAKDIVRSYFESLKPSSVKS